MPANTDGGGSGGKPRHALLNPFAALRPAPGFAAEVAAPPYDVLNSAEASLGAAGKRWSFLHVSKPEIDLPENTGPFAPEVYAKGAENLSRMIAAGVLVRDPKPRYYIYRLTMGEHVQTGLVAAAAIEAYHNNRIRRHEETRPDKETDRVRHMQALGAQTCPVMLAHRPNPLAAEIIGRIVEGKPACDVEAAKGVSHTLWTVDDPLAIEGLSRAFNGETLYIADGHHRSAAAARVAAAKGAADPGRRDAASHDALLVVAFPCDEMRILDYNRVVKDLNGLDVSAFLGRVSESFDIKPSPGPARPSAPRRFGMYVEGAWHGLTLRRWPEATAAPTARLDISLLSRHLFEPVLGIGDPRTDGRIDFIGGIRGLEELERRVDSGDWAVAFALYPTSMDDLMAVAEAGEIMPPKSTWFEPKLADGLISLVLD